MEHTNKEQYLKQTTKTYKRAYNTTYNQYKELSSIVFTGFLELANIKEKLKNINSKSFKEKDLIKQGLYLQTIQRFNSLKNKNLISINYILPDNTIFLRMIDPLKNGEKISKKRELIRYVQENKKAIDSFEIGKNGAAFRFIYPVIEHNSYLGAIDISFSEKAITSSLMKQYYVLSNIILKEANFTKEYLEKTKRYEKSNIKGFLHSKAVLKDLEEIKREDIPKISSDAIMEDLIINGIKKDINSIFIEKSKIIITTIPIIHKITKKNDGFITIVSKGETFGILDNNYFTILFLVIFLNGSILLLIFQQRVKILKDKETMHKIMQKDKQILEQAKLAQMGEMIGNIAHQWRQPLSAISTLASGVKLNHEFRLLKPEDIPNNMDMIVEHTKYLSETIDTFRDFIRDDKEKQEVVIQDIIEESLKIVKASIQNNHIKIKNKIDYKKPLRVKIVAVELSQVIINILNNAKDVIVQNDINDGYIKISLKEDKEHVLISIEDNGGGIEDKILSKIFEPYFTTKHQFQGTGLGLYMSKIIIESHMSGKLKVKNSQEGAKFLIYIPLSY